MPNVRCTVADCTYWDKGNICGAEMIWVTNDGLAGPHDMEVSQLESVQTEAKRSADTCCKTFKPRTESK